MPLITPKVPDNLIEIMKDLAKNVIKENPENIYEYSAVYFENLLKKRDGDINKNYRRFNNLIRKDSKNRMFVNIEAKKNVGNKPSPPPLQPPPLRNADILGQFDETSYIKAALKIQNAFRDFVIKKKLQTINTGSNANEKEVLAAKVIQTAFKRYLDVRQHKKLSIISEEDSKITDLSEKSVNIDEVDEEHVIKVENDKNSVVNGSEEPKLLIEDIGPDENDEKLDVILAKRIDLLQESEKQSEMNKNLVENLIKDDKDAPNEQAEKNVEELKSSPNKIETDIIKINQSLDSEDTNDIEDPEERLDNNNVKILLNSVEITEDKKQENQEDFIESVSVDLNEKNISEKNEEYEIKSLCNVSEKDIENEVTLPDESVNEIHETEVIEEKSNTVTSVEVLNAPNEIQKSNEEEGNINESEMDTAVNNTTGIEEYKTEIVEEKNIIDSSKNINEKEESIQQDSLEVAKEDSNIAVQEIHIVDQEKDEIVGNVIHLENNENEIKESTSDKLENGNEIKNEKLEDTEETTIIDTKAVAYLESSKIIDLIENNVELENSENNEKENELNSTDEEKLDKLQEEKETSLENDNNREEKLNTDSQAKEDKEILKESETLENDNTKRAATKIQKTFRGYRVRRNKQNDEKNKINEETEENQIKVLKSVVIIQKIFRGFMVRKSLSNKNKNLDDSEEPDRNLSTAETIEISDDHINMDESLQRFNLKSPYGCEDYELYQGQSTAEVTDEDKGDKIESMSHFGISPLGCEDSELYQQESDKLIANNEKNKCFKNELIIENDGINSVIAQNDIKAQKDDNDLLIVAPENITEDDGAQTQAAIKIQKNFRGYRVRRDIKVKNNETNDVDDLNKLALSDGDVNITCDEDKAEDKVEGDSINFKVSPVDANVSDTSQGDGHDLNKPGEEQTIEIKVQESPNVDLEIADVIMKADSHGDHVIISSHNIENISEISFTEDDVSDVISKPQDSEAEHEKTIESLPTIASEDESKTEENAKLILNASKDEEINTVSVDEQITNKLPDNGKNHIDHLSDESKNITKEKIIIKEDNDDIIKETHDVPNQEKKKQIDEALLIDANTKNSEESEKEMNEIENQIIHKNNENANSLDDNKITSKERSEADTSKNIKEFSNKNINRAASESEDTNAETTDVESKIDDHSSDFTGDETDSSGIQEKIDITDNNKDQDKEKDYSNLVEVNEEPFIQKIIERPIFEIKNSLQTDDESLIDLSGRDDLSEIENVDLSSYSKDSLEAMYYSLRKNELLLDRMHQRADDERNSSIDPLNLETESELDLPKEDEHENDDSEDAFGTKQSSQIADSDSEDIVLRKLSLESSRLLKDELLSEISKTPMIEESDEYNDSLNVIENLVDDNQEIKINMEEELNPEKMVFTTSEIKNPTETISDDHKPNKDNAFDNELSKLENKAISEKKEKSYDISEENDVVSELSDMDEIKRIGSANNDRRKSFALFKSNTIQIGAMPLTDSYDQDDDMHISRLERKILTTSLSETDSDYIDANDKKFGAVINDNDKNIKTALETIPSTDTDSTIVSAATRIQATARGFLTRRRLQKSSLTTTSISEVCHRSFGNAAINESLENFIDQQNNNLENSDEQEELAAIKIQKKYRQYRDKKFNKQNATIDAEFPSMDDKNDLLGVTEIKFEQRPETNSDNDTEQGCSLPEDPINDNYLQEKSNNLLSVNLDDVHSRRMTLQRGDAVQRNSTPDDSAASNNSPIATIATAKDKTIDDISMELDKETGENYSLVTNIKQTTSVDTLSSGGSSYAESTKSESNVLTMKQQRHHKNELKTIRSLGPRQRSMPVQMDAFLIRILPKHLRKRVRSAGNNNNNNKSNNNKNLF